MVERKGTPNRSIWAYDLNPEGGVGARSKRIAGRKVYVETHGAT